MYPQVTAVVRPLVLRKQKTSIYCLNSSVQTLFYFGKIKRQQQALIRFRLKRGYGLWANIKTEFFKVKSRGSGIVPFQRDYENFKTALYQK